MTARSQRQVESDQRRISFGGSSLAFAALGLVLFLCTGLTAFLLAAVPLILFGIIVAAAGALLLLESAVSRNPEVSEADSVPSRTLLRGEPGLKAVDISSVKGHA